MTDAQFEIHWKRLENKYPTHFKNEDHRSREWTDWYDNFIKLEDEITQKAFDYYFRHMAQNWFPPLPDMLNCYNLMHREKTSKDLGENYGKNEPRQPVTKTFYNAIQNIKKRITASEVPVGFTDNNVKEQYVPAARGGKTPIRVDYTKVDSMAECFVGMWTDLYEKPALAEHRRKKLEEPKNNKTKSDLLSGYFTKSDGERVSQKLCYYCEQRVLKDGAIFKCGGCQVEYA